ncbi:MAG: hypothetical protein ACRDTE_22330 [Pseudonocardiaceae bacterium]
MGRLHRLLVGVDADDVTVGSDHLGQGHQHGPGAAPHVGDPGTGRQTRQLPQVGLLRPRRHDPVPGQFVIAEPQRVGHLRSSLA